MSSTPLAMPAALALAALREGARQVARSLLGVAFFAGKEGAGHGETDNPPCSPDTSHFGTGKVWSWSLQMLRMNLDVSPRRFRPLSREAGCLRPAMPPTP